jgi:hypothetical protein
LTTLYLGRNHINNDIYRQIDKLINYLAQRPAKNAGPWPAGASSLPTSAPEDGAMTMTSRQSIVRHPSRRCYVSMPRWHTHC